MFWVADWLLPLHLADELALRDPPEKPAYGDTNISLDLRFKRYRDLLEGTISE